MTAPGPMIFRYKPAPLSAVREVRLDGSDLWIADEEPVDLAQVDSVFLESYDLGDSRMLDLELFRGDERRSVAFNGGRRGYAGNADAQQHRAAVVAILRALAAARPDAQVTLGSPKGPSLAMFAIGLVSFIAGCGIGAGALASGRGASTVVGAVVPVVMLVLIGAALIIAHWPLAKRPVVGAGALADQIAPPGDKEIP